MNKVATTKKNKNQPWGDDRPEQLRESVPTTIGWNQQIKNLVNPATMLDQLFGATTKNEITPQSISEKQIPRHGNLIFSRVKTESEQQIEQESEVILTQIKQQIVRLERAGKHVSSQVSHITVEQSSTEKGIYFKLFLEWLLTLVKQLTMRLDDSGSWLSAFAENKKKKQGYWKKYKKHGTSFGLSNERTLATQTG